MQQSPAQLPADARTSLTAAASALGAVFRSQQHDMWAGERYSVAPTRIDEARRLRAIAPDRWTGGDLDYVMFKCMTTMGGEPTYRFILPRFLAAAATDPFAGWASASHVQISKLEMLDVAAWRTEEREALAGALIAFAELELATKSLLHREAFPWDEAFEPDSEDSARLIAHARRLSGLG